MWKQRLSLAVAAVALVVILPLVPAVDKQLTQTRAAQVGAWRETAVARAQ